MADEKELQVKIRFISDVSGVKDSRKATDDIKNGNKATGEGAADAEGKVKNLSKSLDNLTKVSAAMGIISGLAIRSMGQAIDAYVKNVGSTEAASKRWMQANQANETSMTRMGRSITEAALPYMETYTKFLDKTAKFMEDNPEVVKAGVDAVGVATGLAAVGGAIKIGSVVAKGVGGMFAAGSAVNAAGGVGATAYGPAAAGSTMVGGLSFLGVLGSVLGGAGIGIGVNNALAKATGEKPIDSPVVSKFLMGLLGAISPGMAAFVGQLRNATGTSDQIGFTDTSKYAAVAAGGSKGSAPLADPLGGNSPAKIIAYAQYYRQEENALRAHLISMARAARDFQRQQEYEAEDYSRQRGRSVRDFNRQETQSVLDFNRQRFIAVRDFNIGMLRSEQDYQRMRSRAGEDFQLQLWDIARSGDAFAYMQATRQYELQQSRGEEDYNIQRQRQVEDFDRQQTDQEEAFNIQRAFRLQSFQISQDDAQVDYDIRRQREAEQRKIQLEDQKFDFDEQKRIRRQAIADTLNDMGDSTAKAAALFSGFTGEMVADMQYLGDSALHLKEYFNTLDLPGSFPSRDVGGYVNDGLYRMHNEEFVLNRNTAKALEQLGGGPLSQGGVLAMLGRGGGGGSITIQDNRKFDSRLSASDRQAIRRENHNDWLEVLSV